MRIGYLLDTHAADYDSPQPSRDAVASFVDELYETALVAEDVGFDGLFVPDRHMRTETYFPSQLQLLATLAVQTERVTLGTYSNILSLYNPMQVAEEAAMIDNISKGRFVYTGAMGYHPDYWRYFGIEDGQQKRLGRFVEGLKVLKKAWASSRDEPFSFDGKFHSYENVFLTPSPYQKPRPPIWLGGIAEPAIARAGRMGEAWAFDPFPTHEEGFQEYVDVYQDAAAEHGSPANLVMMRDGFVGDSREEVEDTFGELWKDELLFYYRTEDNWREHPDIESEDDFTIDNLREHMISGTPEDCIEDLARYEEQFDIDYCVLRFRLPQGPSMEEEREAVRRFGEEVIPYFHEQDDGDWVRHD